MENEDGDVDAQREVAELRVKVDSLKQELKECRAELAKLHKQLSHSERLQRSTESYNEDLRKQVSSCTPHLDEWTLLSLSTREVMLLYQKDLFWYNIWISNVMSVNT